MFQFVSFFINWVRMLYKIPRAKLRLINECSEIFLLARWMEQGCPLSPLLFVFAMEPMAIAIRSSPDMQGFQRASGEETIALYVDDVLLCLGDTQSSLIAVMNIFKGF